MQMNLEYGAFSSHIDIRYERTYSTSVLQKKTQSPRSFRRNLTGILYSSQSIEEAGCSWRHHPLFSVSCEAGCGLDDLEDC